MAELDEKLLKSLDDRLKNMLTTITSLDSALSTVVANSKTSLTDLISLFQASGASLTDMMKAFKGNRLSDLLGINDATSNVKELKEEIERLQKSVDLQGDAEKKVSEKGKVSWFVPEGKEWEDNGERQREAINRLEKARQELKDISLSDEQIMERIVSLINKAATETQKEEEARARGLQKASEQQAVLAKSYKEIVEARSIVSGGKKYGELMKTGGEQFKKYEEFSRILTSIKEQQDAIEKEWAGSKDKGAEIYKQEQAIANAKREASEAQKQAKQEEARQEKELNKAIAEEARRKKEDENEYLRLLKERNKLLEQNARLAENKRNAGLTGYIDTSNYFGSQQDKNDARLRQLNDEIQLYEESVKLTADGQRRKEEMELAHENRMTEIKVQGEQKREQILDRSSKKRQSKSERNARKAESIQKQADTLSKRRIDLNNEISRIEHDRAIRQKTNTNITQQALDAEEKKYQALKAMVDQLTASLEELEKKQKGVTAKAEAKNAPYQQYTQAKEEERVNAELERRNKLLKDNKSTMDSMLPTLQRLASAFGVAFSVRGLAQFGKKLIETRGEFEMQFVAMKQIIGDVDAATKIWNQTLQQALQSPFKAMQLVTYTKQLAAYRIETDKLFDTTKRLADVSAGLGVDMQRLILAYGQVKAANYLRASEIRQFTEAGVNVLGELAQYFTEIRGQAYSTAQVMEMVTKRMVRFEDVEAIFKRMTDAGGTFFNMQEVQAETVKGQINKLRDAYDQMQNTLGEANQGMIKNFISVLIDLTKNWQKVGNTLKWVSGLTVGLISYFKVAAIQSAVLNAAGNVNAVTMRGLSGAIARYVVAAKAGETATRSFSAALASNPIGLVLVAFTSLVGILWAFSSRMKQAREEQEKFNEESREIRDKIAVVESYSDEIIKLSKEINGLNKVEEKSEEQEKRLKEAQEERESLIKELSEENPKYANTIKDIKDNTEKLLEVEKEELAVLRATLVLRQQLSEKTTESTFAGLDEASAELEQANTSLRRNRIILTDYIGTVNDAGEVNSEFFKNMQINSALSEEGLEKIKKAIKNFSSDKSWITFDERYNKFINEINQIQEQPSEKSNLKLFIQSFNSDFPDLLLESLNKVTSYYDDITSANEKYNTSLEETKKAINDIITVQESQDAFATFFEEYGKAVDESDKEVVRRKIIKFWMDELDKANLPKKTREVFEEQLVKSLKDFGITSLTKGEIKQGFLPWQDRVNEAIDKAATDFQKERDKLSKKAQEHLPEIQLYKISDPFQSLEDAQEAILKKLKDIRAKIASYEVKGQVAIDNEEYKALKLEEQEAEKVRIILGAIAKAVGGGGRQENASKLISLIKEMRSEYDKLSKSAYGYAKSEEKVRESYKDSVKKILGKAGITDYDFTTNEGMIKALEKVATKLGKDAAAEVQKYIDQLETEIEINAQVRIREDFARQIEEAFGNYELTVELEKLNLPKGVAEEMFGIEETDLQDLREKLSKMFNALKDENSQLSDESFKKYQDFLKKIDDLERKQQRERLKDYSKYLEAQYSDRVKLEMEYVRKLSQLEAETAIPSTQKNAIREGLKREFEEKAKKQDWEDFKGSEFYVQMMEDLEKQGSASLEVMRKKLLEMRENAENLSPRALKEVVKALEKIDELEKKRIPPLKRIREEQEKLKDVEIKDVYKRIAANQEELAQTEEQERQLERMIMLEEERQKLEEQGIRLDEAKTRLQKAEQSRNLVQGMFDTFRPNGTKEDEERLRILTETLNQAKTEAEKWAEIVRILSGQATIDAQEKGSKYAGLSLSDLRSRRSDAKNRIKELEGVIGKNEELVKAQKDLEDAWNDTWEAVKKWAQSVTSVFDGVMDTIDYFGNSTSTLTAEWKELGDTSISALTDLVSGIQAYQQANAAAKKEGLATGLFTANGLQLAMVVLGVIIKIVQAVAKFKDSKIDKQIEQMKDKVDDLKDAYDRLEKSIEKTFDTVSYMRTYNEEVQNLYEQIEKANEQINAAQGYKDADKRKEAIEAAEDAKQEALDALDEIKQKQIEVFGGIGEDNYRSAAEGFVDVWKSAFLETGDGLQGLQDHFDEFLQDWFTKQLTMKYAAATLKPLFAMMDAAVDQNGIGGVEVLQQELDEMREWAKVYFPKIADELEKNASIWGLEGEGGLSGLAAGIQGMTEEQANILEAYWNDVRSDTSSIANNVATIVGLLSSGAGIVGGGGKGGVDTNPMLAQIELVAHNTSSINTLLQSVTRSGHTMGGQGIKVFVN